MRTQVGLRRERPPDTTAAVSGVEIEMLAGHPVARVVRVDGDASTYDLEDDREILQVTAPQAASVADRFAAAHQLPRFSSVQLVDNDRWVTCEHFDDERPYFRFS